MHAILSPSSAKRWINCPPSARQEQKMPNSTSTAAEEGTLAHRLAEITLLFETEQINKLQFENQLLEVKENKLYSPEMMDYVTDYTDFVLETYLAARKKTKDAVILLEDRIDLTEFVPEGFGTGDVQIIADGMLYFIDLKYGKGVPVFAEKNEQLMAYALGSVIKHEAWYSIKMVRMTIHQPRLNSVTTYEISVEALRAWGYGILKPAAALAFAGQGEYSPGEHCHFCKVAGSCKANATFHMQTAALDFASEVEPEIILVAPKLFKDVTLLSDEEVSFVLQRASLMEKWLKAIKEIALELAVKQGKKWPGFKLVEGRSNRLIFDVAGAQRALAQAQFQMKDYFKPSELRGIGDLEKLVGKNNYPDLLGPFTKKPPGAPTLVPVTDKRVELNSAEAAKLDFAGEAKNETD